MPFNLSQISRDHPAHVRNISNNIDIREKLCEIDEDRIDIVSLKYVTVHCIVGMIIECLPHVSLNLKRNLDELVSCRLFQWM